MKGIVKVREAGDFVQDLKDLILKVPETEPIIAKRIKWFKQNPKDTRLDNHPLKKPMVGEWSFSITDDIRIIYDWLGKTTVRFLTIGPHVKVYSKPKVSKKQSSKR